MPIGTLSKNAGFETWSAARRRAPSTVPLLIRSTRASPRPSGATEPNRGKPRAAGVLSAGVADGAVVVCELRPPLERRPGGPTHPLDADGRLEQPEDLAPLRLEAVVVAVILRNRHEAVDGRAHLLPAERSDR